MSFELTSGNSSMCVVGLLLLLWAGFTLFTRWSDLTDMWKLLYFVMVLLFPGIGPVMVLLLLYYDVGIKDHNKTNSSHSCADADKLQ